MTPEQLKIYNRMRAKKGLRMVGSDGLYVEESDAQRQFDMQVDEVVPYTTGLTTPVFSENSISQGTFNSDDFVKNLKNELESISANSQYLMNAVNAAQDTWNQATDAASQAKSAADAAAEAQKDINEQQGQINQIVLDVQAAQEDATEALNEALAAAGLAETANGTAGEAITEAAAAQQAANQASSDAQQAIIDAANAAGVAGGAETDAAKAIADSATALQQSQQAQNDAIAANTAATNANTTAIAASSTVLFAPTGIVYWNGDSLMSVPASTAIKTIAFNNFNVDGQDGFGFGFSLNGVPLNFKFNGSTTYENNHHTDGTGLLYDRNLIIQIPAGMAGNIVCNLDSCSMYLGRSITYTVPNGIAYLDFPCSITINNENNGYVLNHPTH